MVQNSKHISTSKMFTNDIKSFAKWYFVSYSLSKQLGEIKNDDISVQKHLLTHIYFQAVEELKKYKKSFQQLFLLIFLINFNIKKFVIQIFFLQFCNVNLKWLNNIKGIYDAVVLVAYGLLNCRRKHVNTFIQD